MINDRKKVAIDTDFFYKFTEKDPSGILFMKIMDDMKANPVIHEYVYAHELMGNATAKKLVESGKIVKYKYCDIIDPEYKSEYENYFKRAYKELNYEEFLGNVFSYKHERENLGEIHSMLMAWYMKIPIFMSDDAGAKAYITNKFNTSRNKIEVYNVYDTLEEIGKNPDKKLQWKDIKATVKSAIGSNAKKNASINEIWKKTT